MKFPLRAIALAWSLAGFVACTLTTEPSDRIESDQPRETVSLTVDHRTQWRILWIEGSTDLPDGALIAYRVTHELARTQPADQWPALNLMESGKAAVQDSQYWARLNTTNWPNGEVGILVQFPVPPQPDFVVERYGQFGENLTGDNVITVGEIKTVEIEKTFQFKR